MKTQSLASICTCALLLTAGVLPAWGQPHDPDDAAVSSALAVSVTPFLSLGSTMSSRAGAVVTFPVTRSMSVEAEVGYRRSEIGAASAHVSLIQDLPKLGPVTPYLAAGIGLEQFGAPTEGVDGRIVAVSQTTVAINAGGGIKVPIDDRWGIRTDARWFNPAGWQAPEHWRVFNGVSIRARPR